MDPKQLGQEFLPGRGEGRSIPRPGALSLERAQSGAPYLGRGPLDREYRGGDLADRMQDSLGSFQASLISMRKPVLTKASGKKWVPDGLEP